MKKNKGIECSGCGNVTLCGKVGEGLPQAFEQRTDLRALQAQGRMRINACIRKDTNDERIAEQGGPSVWRSGKGGDRLLLVMLEQ
jgi:hypothetical protein